MSQVTDMERESRIEELGAAIVMSADLTERARLWRQLKDEIVHRSPEQVRAMEEQRGLR